MNFQKIVADDVAKAGFRAKPGPKKKTRISAIKKARWPSILCHTYAVLLLRMFKSRKHQQQPAVHLGHNYSNPSHKGSTLQV
jgi:hypothetical protein